MNIQVLADSDSVAKQAAKIIAIDASAAVAERSRFVMAVSGGHTPWQMLRALADEPVPWKNLHVVQVDERVAPAGDPDRNLTHLRESLLAHAPLPPEQIHAMPVEGKDLEAAAASYERLLQQIAGSPPMLDLAHLGLGQDGHTASLVPRDPVLEVTDRDVALTGFYQQRRRMTLTYPMLNRSRRILWLVTGPEKVEMLARLQRGDPSIPAGRIHQDSAQSWPTAPRLETRINKGMRIGVATDHGGYELKEKLAARLRDAGHEVTDFGAHKLTPEDDYPDFVTPLGRAVASGRLNRGVAVCGSGVGASVCLNKIRGVRACLIEDHFSAKQGVEDDDLNVLCLGGRIEGPELAWDLVQTFLAAKFSEAPRHVRRLAKVAALEGNHPFERELAEGREK